MLDIFDKIAVFRGLAIYAVFFFTLFLLPVQIVYAISPVKFQTASVDIFTCEALFSFPVRGLP